jgi:hypothetical protein
MMMTTIDYDSDGNDDIYDKYGYENHGDDDNDYGVDKDSDDLGSMGLVAVIRSPLTAVVPVGRGFDPRLGYFM